MTNAPKMIEADTLIYIVTASVREDFGTEIYGIGKTPLLIAENASNDEAIGFFGSESMDSAKYFYTPDGGRQEIISQYCESIGLSDFNKVANPQLDSDQLRELIVGTLYESLDDFNEESGHESTFVDSESFQDESFLQDHLNEIGVWVCTTNDLSIKVHIDQKIVEVDGSDYDDLGALANEKLLSVSPNSAALICSSTLTEDSEEDDFTDSDENESSDENEDTSPRITPEMIQQAAKNAARELLEKKAAELKATLEVNDQSTRSLSQPDNPQTPTSKTPPASSSVNKFVVIIGILVLALVFLLGRESKSPTPQALPDQASTETPTTTSSSQALPPPSKLSQDQPTTVEPLAKPNTTTSSSSNASDANMETEADVAEDAALYKDQPVSDAVAKEASVPN